MSLSQVGAGWLELQLIVGAAFIFAPFCQRKRRKESTYKEALLSCYHEAWPAALPLVAFNAAGLALGTISEAFDLQVEASVRCARSLPALGKLNSIQAVQPLALVALCAALHFVKPRSLHLDRFEIGPLAALVLAGFIQAAATSHVPRWTFPHIASYVIYGVFVASHLLAVAYALAWHRYQSDVIQLGTSDSVDRYVEPLALFGLDAGLTSLALIPLTLVSIFAPRSFDALNILVPTSFPGDRVLPSQITPNSWVSMLLLLLRVSISIVVFLSIGRLGVLKTYAAIIAMTAFGALLHDRAASVTVSLSSLAVIVAAGVVIWQGKTGALTEATSSSYAPVHLGNGHSKEPHDNGVKAYAEAEMENGEAGEDVANHVDEIEAPIYEDKGTPDLLPELEPYFRLSPLPSLVVIGLGVLLTMILQLLLLSGPFDLSKVNTRGNTKWIVVTTISAPTSTMEALCALPDWEVAVVADLKTPQVWQSGACHYLSVKDQARLPFATSKMIPFRAYTRKNIGYLYAIANGATVIFDTDDDNLPTEGIELEDPDSTDFMLGFQSDMANRSTLNVYKHFGRADIWPRGYPLEAIDYRHQIEYLDAASTPKELDGRALIQQGLADLDPDVDAIFRLLHPQDIAQVKFCRDAPTLKLARGIQSPFNSQNTLWHRDAFWGLLLPITVTFRVTDIMRGYWAQRILWDIGGALAFRKPSVDQIRNVHDYLEDFDSELQLYSEAGKIAHFLQHWTSSSTTLRGRIHDLFADMETAEFIKRGDRDLVALWLDDLEAIGYTFPEVATPWSMETAVSEARASYEAERSPALVDRVDWQNFKCHVTDKPVFAETLLVVVFNAPYYDLIPTYEEIYKPFFPHIVYYGAARDEKEDPRVTKVDIGYGQFGFRAFMHALEHHPGYGSYMWTNDDVVMNPYALSTLDPQHFWTSKAFTQGFENGDKGGEYEIGVPGESAGHWWAYDHPEIIDPWVLAFDALPQLYRDRAIAASRAKTKTLFAGQNDFFHLPGRLTEEFLTLLKPFSDHDVWHESVFATVIRLFPANETVYNMPDTGAAWLWWAGREQWREVLVPSTYVFHPLKLSAVEAQTAMHTWLIDSARWWRHGPTGLTDE